MNIEKSKQIFQQAQLHIPGGVNSPVRSFKQVGGTPIFMQRAQGAYVFDVDKNKYIDYINSWGPMILGHNRKEVVNAIKKQVSTAFTFGAPTILETEIAILIKKMVPNIDLIRMVNSGTEACMSAVRLARGFTQKNKIIKFEGHYHGHSDMFLKKAGSGMATLNIKQDAGIPTSVLDDTIILPFNDFEILEQTIKKEHLQIASIICEPVAGNMGCILPKKGYLELIRNLCTRYNIVFIMDEVMTGFRLSKGGAQETLNVWADLITYGKVIGGGMPVGAFGGRKDIMSCIAPLGAVYQAGTLSGNPIAMTAGLTTLQILNANKSIYTALNQKGKNLKKQIGYSLKKKKIIHQINQLGSMISVHFCSNEVVDFKTATEGNNDIFKRFFHHALAQGIYLPPSAFETWFISDSIGDTEIKKTIKMVETFEK